MKRLLTTLVIVMGLFAPSFAVGDVVKFSDLVKTDGLYYKKTILSWLFKGEPFTGKVGGQVQGTLRRGKWHGPYATFHDNGRLSSKGTWRDGKR